LVHRNACHQQSKAWRIENQNLVHDKTLKGSTDIMAMGGNIIAFKDRDRQGNFLKLTDTTFPSRQRYMATRLACRNCPIIFFESVRRTSVRSETTR
jgi:hypothetical protein